MLSHMESAMIRKKSCIILCNHNILILSFLKQNLNDSREKGKALHEVVMSKKTKINFSLKYALWRILQNKMQK